MSESTKEGAVGAVDEITVIAEDMRHHGTMAFANIAALLTVQGALGHALTTELKAPYGLFIGFLGFGSLFAFGANQWFHSKSYVALRELAAEKEAAIGWTRHKGLGPFSSGVKRKALAEGNSWWFLYVPAAVFWVCVFATLTTSLHHDEATASRPMTVPVALEIRTSSNAVVIPAAPPPPDGP